MIKTTYYRLIIYIVLLIFALYFLLPIVIMILTSLKNLDEIRTGDLISLPQNISFFAWQEAWGHACIGTNCTGIKNYFFNSIKITVPAVSISVILGSFNGYILSKFKFKGSEIIFALIILGCFIPFQIVLLPLSQTLGFLGLSQSIWGLILTHSVYGVSFTTLFFRNYYASVPTSLIKAAKIDGAGFFKIFFRIMLPLSTPIFIVSIIWQTTQIWNDFLFGVSFASSDTQPVTVALNNLTNTSTSVKRYNVDMAAAIIAVLPTLVVYVISGKYFVRGLMAGSIKG